MNSPLRFILEDGIQYGQMYNSWDKTYHLAEYIPYKSLPYAYACGLKGNISPSRSERIDRKKCEKCFEFVREV